MLLLYNNASEKGRKTREFLLLYFFEKVHSFLLLGYQHAKLLHILLRNPRFIAIVVIIELFLVFFRIEKQVIQPISLRPVKWIFPLISLKQRHPKQLIPAMFFHDLPHKPVQITHLMAQMHLAELDKHRLLFSRQTPGFYGSAARTGKGPARAAADLCSAALQL